MLKYALLGFLKYQPSTGYDLKQIMDVSTNHFWHAKQSQIYTTLKKLEEKGLVRSHTEPQEGRPDRRVYEITEQGAEDLDQWLGCADIKLEPVKMTLLLRLFFSAGQNKEAMLSELHMHRDLHARQVERYRTEAARVIAEVKTQEGPMKKDAIMWETTRRFGEMHEKMFIQWIDETIAIMEKEL